MLTPEELSAIEARANDAIEGQWIFDVPALLAHIREQAAEILYWLNEKQAIPRRYHNARRH